MTDFSFSDDPDLKKLNAQVLEEPEEFEHWEKLVRASESQEGGLHRNSSPGAIASTRDVYDKFLARFPLFFGYWKKYADLEFAIAGTEAAEMVYERGVASIGISVDLWTNYCTFKVDTSHDPEVIRELFERGADSVGLDFLAHPFWDKYIEFEERMEAQDHIFAILDRIIHIPMHQYARYYQRYQTMSASRPIYQLAPPGVLERFRQEVIGEPGTKQKSERDIDQEMRQKVGMFHEQIFNRTQNETTKRWTYEAEVKRPYYHVTELDEQQLTNWRKYLDFEETEGDYVRTRFLYERCLVTAANYEEFWLRYARWMLAQEGKQEEVRNIYQRASCIYVPISKPTVRLFYAQFEESEGNSDIAADIHEAILMNFIGHVETIVSFVNLQRRQHGFEAAVEMVKRYTEDASSSMYTRGALVSEWARLVWKVKSQTDEARSIYQNNKPLYLDCAPFWASWLEFEIQLPSDDNVEHLRYKFIKAVYDDIRKTSRLAPPVVKDLSAVYFAYLKQRGGKDAMKELMQLDREINGSVGASSGAKAKTENEGDESGAYRQAAVGNGNPGAAINEAPTQQGGNEYAQYYAQQWDQPVNGNQQVLVQ